MNAPQNGWFAMFNHWTGMPSIAAQHNAEARIYGGVQGAAPLTPLGMSYARRGTSGTIHEDRGRVTADEKRDGAVGAAVAPRCKRPRSPCFRVLTPPLIPDLI